MSEPFIGEIRMFGFNFAPSGWAMCNGQLLPISQNTALFSLLGTFYGGNGTSDFALPDLRSRVPLHMGQGVGLSPYTLGEDAGLQTATLNDAQLPSHTHTVQASDSAAKLRSPGTGVLGKTTGHTYEAAPDGVTTMNAAMISPTGEGQPFSIVQPVLTLNFCIALQGIFPSRN